MRTPFPLHTAYYQYDASGERTFNLSGSPSQQLVNGEWMSFTKLDQAVLYASPYLVGTPKGYTKHYYAGSEKIAYRISGGGLSELNHCLDTEADPSAPGDALLAEGVLPPSFIEKLQRNTLALEQTVQCLALQSPSLVTGVLLPEEPFQLVRQFEQVQNADQGLSFYHTDHLGSSAWITDHLGRGIQHFLYLPFGEPWVDQQNSGFHTYFTFSGKERDMETGYGYFGARYYSSDLGIWLSVDPMAEMYPEWSPYTYCRDNPVMLIDPNGEFDTRAEARQYRREHNTGGRIRKDQNLGGYQIQNQKEGLAYKKMPEVAQEGVETIGMGQDGVMTMPIVTAEAPSSAAGNVMQAGMGISLLLLTNDVTGVGVADDVLIPPIMAGTAIIAGALAIYDAFSKGGHQRIKHDPGAIEKAKQVLSNPNSSKKERNAAKQKLNQQEKNDGLRNKQKNRSGRR